MHNQGQVGKAIDVAIGGERNPERFSICCFFSSNVGSKDRAPWHLGDKKTDWFSLPTRHDTWEIHICFSSQTYIYIICIIMCIYIYIYLYVYIIICTCSCVWDMCIYYRMCLWNAHENAYVDWYFTTNLKQVTVHPTLGVVSSLTETHYRSYNELKTGHLEVICLCRSTQSKITWSSCADCCWSCACGPEPRH